jgi:hypothetical protein
MSVLLREFLCLGFPLFATAGETRASESEMRSQKDLLRIRTAWTP